MYLQLGTDGLRGLENYDPATKVRPNDHLDIYIKLMSTEMGPSP